VVFFGPRTDEERFLEYVEDISLELKKRASLKEETDCALKKDIVDESLIQFDAEQKNSSLSHLSSALLERVRRRSVLSNDDSDLYDAEARTLESLCNILQQEEISEEDLAMVVALHRSYMEHKSKSKSKDKGKFLPPQFPYKDDHILDTSSSSIAAASCHSEHLLNMDDDDSNFLEMFSLSSSNLGKSVLSASCPGNLNSLTQQTSPSENSCNPVDEDSFPLVDIEDPERSESTTFYLDIPPISPSIHFARKSQSSETQERV